jgi:hypothetical protein
MDELTAEGKTAYLSFRRKGFGKDALSDDLNDAFKLAASPLTKIGNQLELFVEKLNNFDNSGVELSDLFEQDREAFSQNYKKIYGEQS